MSTYAESDGAIQVERRTHPHLRAVYSDARIRIDHFFHDSSNWAGTPIDYLALRVVHEAYPDLSTQDVRTLVAAIERRYEQEQRQDQDHVQQLATQSR
ncbi:MAG: hypothetical protein H6935_05920 [Thiobacillus sp.]|nr:hypothetical protein [Thiobacillus sp.]